MGFCLALFFQTHNSKKCASNVQVSIIKGCSYKINEMAETGDDLSLFLGLANPNVVNVENTQQQTHAKLDNVVECMPGKEVDISMTQPAEQPRAPQKSQKPSKPNTVNDNRDGLQTFRIPDNSAALPFGRGSRAIGGTDENNANSRAQDAPLSQVGRVTPRTSGEFKPPHGFFLDAVQRARESQSNTSEVFENRDQIRPPSQTNDILMPPPPAPPRAYNQTPNNYEEDALEKQATLLELQRLKQAGKHLSRDYDMSSSLVDMQTELRWHSIADHEDKTVSMMKNGLQLGLSGLELANRSFGPYLDMEGWSKNMTNRESMERFDGPLRRIYAKYYQRSSVSPEQEIIWAILSSLAMHHLKSKLSDKVASVFGGNQNNNSQQTRTPRSKS